MKLTVKRASKDEVFGDIARVSEEYRTTPAGKTIRSGTVCRITVNGRSAYAVMKGTPDESVQLIYMDEYLRLKLKVEPKDTLEFKFYPAGLYGSVVWTWNATDPVYRVASRMSVLSLALGIISLVLGALPFSEQIQTLFEPLRSLLEKILT